MFAQVTRTRTHKGRSNAINSCCVRPAWEQLLGVQKAEQRLHRCDDVEYAWRKPATQREIRTVETHFQTGFEDQARKNPTVVADVPLTFTQQLQVIFSQRSDVALMIAREEKVPTDELLQFTSTLLSIPAASAVKTRPEWNWSYNVVLQKHVKMDGMH